MSHDWAEQLMTDHQITEKVFEAVDLSLPASVRALTGQRRILAEA